MARVFIPPQMRELTGGREVVVVSGTTVREVIDGLELIHPGTRSLLCRDNQLRPGLMIAVDSSVASTGLRTGVDADSEVHFLPALGGG